MTLTLSQVLARHDIQVADEMLADIEVPVLTGLQRQGDVLIVPRPACGAVEHAGLTVIPGCGVPVVRGEATGNTHLLDAVTGLCGWSAHRSSDEADLILGILFVPDGGVAALIHTDEHGCNMIGAGTYVLSGKREQADVIRRVAD